MPHSILVIATFRNIRNLTFHFGTVTPLHYLASCLGYLSGNIRLTNAYSEQNGTLLLLRGTQHLLSQ
jgi:hypothetical protein